MDDEQHRVIGRAIERLLELGAQDDVLRPGMEALARSILRLLGVSPEALVAEPTAGPTVASPRPFDVPAESLETLDAPLATESPAAAGAEAGIDQEGSPPADLSEPSTPLRRRPERDVVPMDRASFLALLEDAAREVRAADQGTLAATLLGEMNRGASSPVQAADGYPAGPDDDHERREYDAVLPGIVTRARLRADVTRAVAERERTGTQVDEVLLHRARSEGCPLWMLDLRHPDPAAVDSLAECMDAVADAAEFIVLLAKHDPADRARRARAVGALAAVQSALRIATMVHRQTADEEQIAAFGWLKEATATERIFVDRHMRLDDPLDPAHVADVMAPLHLELDGLMAETTREAAVKKRLQQVRYLSGRIAAGKSSAHDTDKVAEAVCALVADGMPASSLELRDLLLPVLDHLPDPDGHPAAYGRVIADLTLHRERLAQGAVAVAVPQKAVSDEVKKVAELLRGTEIVLVGGERRVEAERAVIDAFGLSGIAWFTLTDDPSLPELERAIAKPEVSAMFQLIRWSRHKFGDAAEIAAAHDKPFIRVPRGYNPNALAKAVLEQASDRLRDDLMARNR